METYVRYDRYNAHTVYVARITNVTPECPSDELLPLILQLAELLSLPSNF